MRALAVSRDACFVTRAISGDQMAMPTLIAQARGLHKACIQPEPFHTMVFQRNAPVALRKQATCSTTYHGVLYQLVAYLYQSIEVPKFESRTSTGEFVMWFSRRVQWQQTSAAAATTTIEF
ncbi:hypothetical protein D3C78_1453530 [compost metagenome]